MESCAIEIHRITEQQDEKLPAVIRLFREYLQELDEQLDFQHVDKEMTTPLVKYGPPHGALLLALYQGQPVGCVALQSLGETGVCEMKRLYVQPDYRRFKIGRLLAEAILQEAKALDYTIMKLDTLQRLQAAIGLYYRLGFTETTAYYHNPLPEVVYMEKRI